MYYTLKRGDLNAVGASCSTLYYNPLRTGAGPRTAGKIAVYTITNEHDYIEVGMELVKLVKHDIRYKTTEATHVEGKFAHLRGNERVTSMTIFWNDGDPYASEDPRPGTKLFPAPRRDDTHCYNPDTDVWNNNVVRGQTQEHFHGKWILISNYDDESDINITIVWHKLKAKIKSGELRVIEMVCPAPKYKGALPEIHISTSQRCMDAAGKTIISMVKHNISYIRGKGLFRDDEKTLYWNDGRPSYDNACDARPGITGNWRK